MRFEPRIVNEDVAEVEEPLPRDLALLGQQLTDDARWLARQYEPDRSGELLTSITRVGRGPWWLKWSAAAMLIVATGLATAGGWLVWTGQDSEEPNRQVVSTRAQDDGRGLHKPGTQWPFPPRVPVVGFEDLSGPQQEAVLDLWEDLAHSSSSLSI